MTIPAQHISRLPFRQRGIAAITAILVVAMATILAVELAWDLNLDIRRTENLLLRTQARQFAIGAEILAADALRTDFENDSEDDQFCDYLDEDWHTEMSLPVEGGSVQGRLTDLQGRFNLNNLVVEGEKDQVAYDQFVQLLEILALDPGLAPKVLDWIDPDQTPELGGAEDDTYTSRLPAYRTANTWFTTTTELLAVDGFIDPGDPDDGIFKTLERYVTALPTGQKINVNTAEDPVLLSMATDARAARAEDLRVNRAYCKLLTGDADETLAFMADAKDIVSPEFMNTHLAVSSNYFQLKVLVTLGSARLTMYSLLYRDAKGTVITRLRYFNTK
jgi:general secretion pathway protein K